MSTFGQSRLLLCVVLAALYGSLAMPAPAQASYLGRGLTLSRSQWELGFGLGLGRQPEVLGLGLNLELGYGLTSSTEMRLRTGVRFGSEGRRTQADHYGRPYETETYNTGGDSIANPEIGFRFLLTRGGGTVELALDARFMLPVGSDLGLMFGVPLSLRLGSSVRLDTGLFVPFQLNDGDHSTVLSFPLHLFFRLDGGTSLGVLTGIRYYDGNQESIPLGFAIGRQVTWDAELRLWMLFPDVSHSGAARVFGAGAGLYVTF